MGIVQFSQCSICAVDITWHSSYHSGPIPWDPSLWRETAVVLRGPNESSCRQKLIDHLAEPITLHMATSGGDYPRKLELLPSGQSIRLQHQYSDDGSFGHFWYFNVHDTCYMMATRVMQTSLTSRLRCLRDLWVTLDRRCEETKRTGCVSWGDFLPSIPAPKTTNGATKRWSDYYIPNYNPGSYDNWWLVDPFHIPDLTSRLLSNLQHVEPHAAICESLQTHLTSLPRELHDRIVSLLLEETIGLECTHVLPQSYWRQLFLRIPFLWDLDERLVPGLKDSEGKEWDWEKIFRQVMARAKHLIYPEEGDTQAWNYSEVGLDVPSGFINRRRIWQLLEDMDPAGLEWEATQDHDLLDPKEFENDSAIDENGFECEVASGWGWEVDEPVGTAMEW
ncbi:hypothetical protein ACHAPT_007283 [Fusarium lateritium]